MEIDFIPDGALIDQRPPAQKEKDYKADEIAAGHSEPFKHERPKTLTASLYSQEKTSSCVPHAILTQLEYEGIVAPAPKGISQLLVYRKRFNYAQAGGLAVDIYDKIIAGQKYNIVAPISKGYTEEQANKLPYLLGEHLIGTFDYFNITNYKSIAGDVAKGKAVVIFIYASKKEWEKEYVEPTDNVEITSAYVRHAVCLIPNGDFTEKGKEWLSVHDSAAFGKRHLRYISKDFLLSRTYYASKVYKEDEVVVSPINYGEPVNQCKFGERSNNVKMLQSYLVAQGFLASQYTTGLYGQLTCKAVLEWQLTHNQLFTYMRPVRELTSLEGKYWGAQSVEVYLQVKNK